ncbi:MAG: yvbK [Thermomicrobiales bacterium]|nr:yvbK [Thermomicrobiales bacterium]
MRRSPSTVSHPGRNEKRSCRFCSWLMPRLRSAADGEPLGVSLVLSDPADPGSAELRAVAIDPTQHHRGLGQRMLASVLADLRTRGFRRAVVGTSNAGIGQIAFYQKAGFRLWRVERDYFTPQKGYDPDERE